MFWPLSETCITNMVLVCSVETISSHHIPEKHGVLQWAFSQKPSCVVAYQPITLWVYTGTADQLEVSSAESFEKKTCFAVTNHRSYISSLCVWVFGNLLQAEIGELPVPLLPGGSRSQLNGSGFPNAIFIIRVYSLSASKSVGYQRVQNEAETPRLSLDVHVPSPPGDGGIHSPTSRNSCPWQYPGK